MKLPLEPPKDRSSSNSSSPPGSSDSQIVNSGDVTLVDLDEEFYKYKAPLFLEYLILCTKRANAKKHDHLKTLLPPPPVEQSKTCHRRTISEIKALEDPGEFLTEIEELLKSKNIEDIRQGSRAMMGKYYDPGVRTLLPEGPLNRIAELCAKYICVQEYAEFYVNFVFGIRKQYQQTRSFEIIDKYDVQNRLQKISGSSTSEWFLLCYFGFMDSIYFGVESEIFLKFLISFAPKLKFLPNDYKAVSVVYEDNVILAADMKSPLWIDLYNAIKHEVPDLDICKLMLSFICISQHYKSCKNYFQRREFDMTIQILQSNPLKYECLVENLTALVRDHPEKVYDQVLVAKVLATYPMSKESRNSADASDTTAGNILCGIAWLFPPLGAIETYTRSIPITYNRKKVPLPAPLADACTVFEYYLQTLNKVSMLDAPPQEEVYINTYYVCDYMMLKHRNEFVELAKKYKLFQAICKLVKHKTFDSSLTIEPASLAVLLSIPELIEEFRESGLPDALIAVYTNKYDDVRVPHVGRNPDTSMKFLIVMCFQMLDKRLNADSDLVLGEPRIISRFFKPGEGGIFPNKVGYEDIIGVIFKMV